MQQRKGKGKQVSYFTSQRVKRMSVLCVTYYSSTANNIKAVLPLHKWYIKIHIYFPLRKKVRIKSFFASYHVCSHFYFFLSPKGIRISIPIIIMFRSNLWNLYIFFIIKLCSFPCAKRSTTQQLEKEMKWVKKWRDLNGHAKFLLSLPCT